MGRGTTCSSAPELPPTGVAVRGRWDFPAQPVLAGRSHRLAEWGLRCQGEGEAREARHGYRLQRPEAYREVLIDSDGLAVALSVWNGRPGAPAVLFLPGTMTHPLFYEEFLDALNRAGLTVVGLHPPGHGKSPRLRRRRLTYRDLLRSALDALTWVRREYPTSAAVVLGSSQGGVLALSVAAASTDATAVFAHNVLDPELPSTLRITRTPTALSKASAPLRRGIGVLGRIAPWIPVPFHPYLDLRRVCSNPKVTDQFYTDPLGLRSDPLGLLAEMISTELPGPARCPVVVIASNGDPLFDLDYTREVFQRSQAPAESSKSELTSTIERSGTGLLVVSNHRNPSSDDQEASESSVGQVHPSRQVR